jgi:hypothetical protein
VLGRVTRRLVLFAFAVVAVFDAVVVATLSGRLNMKISSLVVERTTGVAGSFGLT